MKSEKQRVQALFLFSFSIRILLCNNPQSSMQRGRIPATSLGQVSETHQMKSD